MPYATASQYIQKFGLDDAAQLLADEQNTLTSQLLADAVAVSLGGSWTGTPAQADKDVANAALARLNRQLVVSSNFMDGYLRSAVTLPLAVGDANAGVLEDCCLALVRYGLADDSDNATERMEKAYEQWRSWLKDVQAGRAQLVGATGEAVPSTGRVRTGQAVSMFDWRSFGGGQ
ncbi:phage protein Gp36 family protein [Rhodoferax fermentans]|uniref:DUF1320 domain-containing protein n=1 Tax=Rhodoferax fermentans TaxID=28066 RepID=A0A1T1APA5_RHOFE|nr:phage protein Gp36 family protein [Rhodoferax fermentans]MBK1683396.1 DUF1320 domain-containing protein [Rhodoferax fermentans]OOV05857.1 hypothetical protein RF819_03240 [Rhodoferax fermentans]